MYFGQNARKNLVFGVFFYLLNNFAPVGSLSNLTSSPFCVSETTKPPFGWKAQLLGLRPSKNEHIHNPAIGRNRFDRARRARGCPPSNETSQSNPSSKDTANLCRAVPYCGAFGGTFLYTRVGWADPILSATYRIGRPRARTPLCRTCGNARRGSIIDNIIVSKILPDA